MAAIDVRLPRSGTPFGPVYEIVIEELWKRTGGDSDSVDAAMVNAATAQTQADLGVANASTAQVAADAAQAAAAAAQVDATQALTDAAAALAAAVAAQADADDVYIAGLIDNVDDAGASLEPGRFNITCPYAGTITKISVRINNTVTLATVLTSDINGVAITNGAVTITDSGSQGDRFDIVPSGSNTVAIGDRIACASDGEATSASKAEVLYYITRS